MPHYNLHELILIMPYEVSVANFNKPHGGVVGLRVVLLGDLLQNLLAKFLMLLKCYPGHHRRPGRAAAQGAQPGQEEEEEGQGMVARWL